MNQIIISFNSERSIGSAFNPLEPSLIYSAADAMHSVPIIPAGSVAGEDIAGINLLLNVGESRVAAVGENRLGATLEFVKIVHHA